MSTFTAIPIRANGDDVVADWWNALRLAGVSLEGFVGGGFITNDNFTLTNNQVASNVTGLSFNSAVYTSVIINAEIRRATATQEKVWSGRIIMIWRAFTSTWDVQWEGVGDETGVTFTIVTVSTTGQLQYATDNLTGATYTGQLKFKAITFAA